MCFICKLSLRNLIIFLFIISGSSQAQVRSVLPHFYWNSINYNQDNSRQRFETPEEAYAASAATMAAAGDYATGMFVNTFYGMINGLPIEYDMNWVTAQNQQGGPSPAAQLDWECPQGTTFINNVIKGNYPVIEYYSCVASTELPKPDPCNCFAVGKPIYPATGIEKLTETDYGGIGVNTLSFTRTYRSDRNGWLSNYQVAGIDFTTPAQPVNINPFYSGCYSGIGSNTLKPYCFQLLTTGSTNDFAVQRGNGRMLSFGTATDLSPVAPDVNDRVSNITDATGTMSGWSVYNAADDSSEIYDLTGRLQSTSARNGQKQTLTYSTAATPINIAPQAGLLISVKNQFGAQLNMTYDSAGRLASLIGPTGSVTSYAYDEATSIVVSGNTPGNNLTSVTYPDGKKRLYWYNEQDKTGGADLPIALTGITDENGTRYATITYSPYGKAVSTELAGGNQLYQVAYPYGKAVVTSPLGAISTYDLINTPGVVRTTGMTQSDGNGGNASTSLSYDANSNVTSSTDLKGIVSTYVYDLTRNLETSRTEASGTPQARTTTTTWHPTYRLPLQIAEPKRLTTFTYDASGNVLTKTVQATTDANGSQGLSATLTGKARTWTNTYNSFGQILTATGPRTDVNDTTTYSYDTSGNLTSITNAAGHVTTMSNYDLNGRVGMITAPNGETNSLTYTPRGWLSSKVVTANGVGETTSYRYDGVGQLIQVTLPDSSTVSYTYDDAHRLTGMSDSLGNSIVYTLDNMGNRVSEQVKDTGGVLERQTLRVFDALSRIQQETGGM